MDETPKKENKKSKIIWTTIFIVVNVIVIGWTFIKEYRDGQGAAKFTNVHVDAVYLIPAALCMIAAIVAETAKYALVMKRTLGYTRWTLCRRTVLLGRYYDNITPSGIGGQPFQIYYMKKHGIPNAESAAIPIAGFLSMQFSFIILALLCVFFGAKYVESDAVRIASYVGIVCYSVFPFLILLFTFFPTFSEKLTRGIVMLLAGLRLVKDREKTSAKFIENVEGYSHTLREFLRHVPTCIGVMILALVYQIALCSVPYFVILAFGGQISFLNSFVTMVTIYAAITFIPTPGNAGAAEGVFYAVFSVLTSGYVFWAMLTWRFFVFYAYIIYGIGLTIVDSLEQRRKNREEIDGKAT